MDFKELQYRQHIHDELFHRDIFNLPPAGAFKHHILHLAKYNAKLQEKPEDVCVHLTDMFSTCLSLLNLLKIIHPYADSYEADNFHHEVIRLVGRLSKCAEELDHFATFQDIILEAKTHVMNLMDLVLVYSRKHQLNIERQYHLRMDGIRRKFFLGDYQRRRYIDILRTVDIPLSDFDDRPWNMNRGYPNVTIDIRDEYNKPVESNPPTEPKRITL